MELFHENGTLVGRVTSKELEWMSDIQIPVIAQAARAADDIMQQCLAGLKGGRTG